ncbi:MAG: hypothetical protein ACRCXD_01005, partial [Luteolibacter sp.]
MSLKPKGNVLADDNSRKLIGRVLKENFHLYIPRYILAFLLMGGAAAATGISAFMMQNVTKVLFGAADQVTAAPEMVKQAQTWIPDIGG